MGSAVWAACSSPCFGAVCCEDGVGGSDSGRGGLMYARVLRLLESGATPKWEDLGEHELDEADVAADCRDKFGAGEFLVVSDFVVATAAN